MITKSDLTNTEIKLLKNAAEGLPIVYFGKMSKTDKRPFSSACPTLKKAIEEEELCGVTHSYYQNDTDDYYYCYAWQWRTPKKDSMLEEMYNIVNKGE